MWKIYGENAGIAIRSTWGNLRESLKTDAKLFGGRIKYLDYERDRLPTNTYTDDYFYKRNSFDFEHEIRLISHAPDLAAYIQANSADETVTWPKVSRIDVDSTKLIQNVFVHPHHANWVRDAIESVSRQFGFQWPIIHSNLYTSRIFAFNMPGLKASESSGTILNEPKGDH
ncbi:hypothetical protein [Rhodococcus sp. 1168]|uniref:hypothetical protein n=1 Tax=Rhodococcus sp. 1168 TaxID=2018041 RepID=UPI000A0DD801|nr:hypothetical protein [Rhodococcus sp. 1168]ORI12833.1 hypothetical protein BJI47_00300 [Rhodococcus sp. 1168]